MDQFILKSVDVTFENNTDLKSFVSQFQIHCKKLICIVNDKFLRFYTKKDQLPKHIKYLHGIKNEYYFEDLDTHDIYCIFGKDAANIFYPNLTDIHNPIIVTYSNIEPKSIIIYHDKKIETKWTNRELEIIESHVFI